MTLMDEHVICAHDGGPTSLWCHRDRDHTGYHVDKNNNVWKDDGTVVVAVMTGPGEWDTSQTSLGHWRVGRKGPETRRNLWYSPDGTPANEVFKGVMFDPADGPRVAAALNGSHSPELAKALELLVDLASTELCRYDHNNECQEHGYYDDGTDLNWRCPHQRAREMIIVHGLEPR